MGLESFTTSDDDKQEKHHHNNNKLDKARLFNDGVCPNCGQEAKHLRGNEYRCNTNSSKCSVVYYFANNFSDKNA